MKRIKVDLSEHSYDVVIGLNILTRLPDEIRKLKLSGKFLIVTDSQVYKLHKDKIAGIASKLQSKIKIIKSGENSKSFESLESIFESMLNERLDRTSTIIAVGGGMVGDLTGFAASIYMRGINYIQVPTTLLAAVDSSVGGKTAVNFHKYKNIVGSFYQPKLVFADMDFFSTLPEKEFISGYGEALKYSFIAGKNYYSLLNGRYDYIKNSDAKISRIISESVIFKSSVVEKDEKETGLRKILNFGHTFGHAYETAMNYKIKHGEGVILGIICALKLSCDKGYLPENLFNKYLKYVYNTGIRLAYKLPDEEQLYSIMLKDKKNKAGKIKFVLLKDIGQTICDAEADKAEVISAIQFAESYFF